MLQCDAACLRCSRAPQAKRLSHVELEKADDHIELRINNKMFLLFHFHIANYFIMFLRGSVAREKKCIEA
jgi:hypothetical protein